MTNSDPTPSNPRSSGSNFWVDFGPIAIFVLIYNVLRRDNPDGAIYIAAAVFTVAAIIALGYSRLRLGKFSGMLIFTTLIIIITVALAFFFQDPRFIYMKPTVINAVFGVVAIGGVMVGKNVIKLMIGEAFELPAKAWNTLAIRWGLFFFAMAALNELVWRTQTEAFWANFKLFGFLPITLVFGMSQVPFLMKHGKMKADDISR